VRPVSGATFYGGDVDAASGLFSPASAGTYTACASIDGIQSATSGSVTVYAADHLRAPYTYPATAGITYAGYSEGSGSGSVPGPAYGIDINYPTETVFSADGFFTLEGTITNADAYDYAWVLVSKGAEETSYFVQGNFKTRIWLRFGEGEYAVEVYILGDIDLDLGGQGDVYSGSYYKPALVTFNVTNTRNEDGSYLYPSAVIQSDDFRVSNLARELSAGQSGDRAKVKAIHDYFLMNTVYDYDSLEPLRRKKQDAVTTLGARYHIDGQYEPAGHFAAVCEGYSNTLAALYRSLGIATRFIGSSVMGHAWNHVLVEGSWKFLDATWDDPAFDDAGNDGGPGYAGYDYFLLNSMNGKNGDHYAYYVENRAAAAALPQHKGMPDGWY
jgi:hypothetical protein